MLSALSPDGLPSGFASWSPIAQATALGLATFVQEDVPTISAAVLAATGRLTWTTAFLGCFLGIWAGDALLYLIARVLGRPLLEMAWARRWAPPESVARSERWFSEKGSWLLVSSRFIPGTRLPTYLAAGFLRLPFGRFLAVTGSAVAVWTTAIFGLAMLFGDRLADGLQRWDRGGIGLLAVVAVGFVLVRIAGRSAAWLGRQDGSRRSSASFRTRAAAFYGRWTCWEFWPAWLFYAPVVLRYAWLAFRHRGLTLPSAANPGITTGGLVGESKFATLRDLMRTSPEHTAEAWLLGPGTAAERIRGLDMLRSAQDIAFPFILKPDLGQRGMGVKLVRDEDDVSAYLRDNAAPIVVQRYVPGPSEVGVFYYRFPHESRGRIFAITEKIFPVLVGDGIHTVEELVWRDERARFVAARYLARFASRCDEVLAVGETLRLVEAGNHAQGCIFRDGGRFATEALADRIDTISKGVPGFFIGRYDLRFTCEEELRAGRGFRILELNGAAAEATSIYDARNSLVAAYRTLFRQWDLVFAIGAANRALGTTPTPPLELIRVWRAANRLIATYPIAD